MPGLFDTAHHRAVDHEALVGEPPFTGSTAQAVLGRIVTGDADRVTEHRRTVPPNVEAFVEHHPDALIGIYPSNARIGREVTLRIRYSAEAGQVGYEFHQLVQQLARERGVTVRSTKRKISSTAQADN